VVGKSVAWSRFWVEKMMVEKGDSWKGHGAERGWLFKLGIKPVSL
jgi:hypothetical protein